METQIIKENQNPIFNRKEIELLIITDVTPKIKEAEEIIAEKFSSNPESIKVKKISGKFGEKKFTIIANVYDSKESKDKIEIKFKKDKKQNG